MSQAVGDAIVGLVVIAAAVALAFALNSFWAPWFWALVKPFLHGVPAA